MEKNLEALRRKAADLPLCPGVYLMRDGEGNVIYVGKSRKMKNRVSSYFLNGPKNLKTQKMVSRVVDFDYILCDTEMEALTLENTLIKKYAPHYNIRLKDAKSYPYIKVTNEEYPRLVVTRQRGGDKGKYFGPYSSSATAHEVVDTLSRIFSLPTCRRSFPKDIGKERPCLYASLGRCVAPCTGEVKREDYLSLVRGAEGVLAGDIRHTEKQLTEAMGEAARAQKYEQAALYRDALTALRRLDEKQKVVGDEKEDRDIFALWHGDICSTLAVLNVREGKLLGKQEFLMTAAMEETGEDALSAIVSFYEDSEALPREVLLESGTEEDCQVLSDYLSQKKGSRVTVRCPQRGRAREQCQMAYTNAKNRGETYLAECAREDKTAERLGELLGLEKPPHRIEAYDISQLGKEYITAAMAVSYGTKLQNGQYRTFRMKTLEGVDDCGAMREALTRRLSHLGDGTPSLGQTPDLILLDGGVGQVHAVRAVMEEMGITIPVFGMVKDAYHKTRCLTDGERELSIATEGSVYVFIYKLQEEVHRIAVKSVMGAKGKSLRRSQLEDIHGIGPKKAKAYLKCLPISRLRSAGVNEMEQAGIPRGDAQKIYHHFHGEEPS